MNRNKILKCAVVAIVFLVLLVASFFLGDKYAVEHISIKRVTSDQIATAMQGDYFYSRYRYNTLLLNGVVYSLVQSQKDTIVTFQTNTANHASCDLGSYGKTLKPGDAITIVSPAARAVRQGSDVVLKDCVTP